MNREGEMSTPVSFFDAGNPLLGQVTARMDTGTITELGEAPKGVVTIRTASTTVTVVLGADDLRIWVDLLSSLHDSLRGPANMPQRQLQPATFADVAKLGKNGKGGVS